MPTSHANAQWNGNLKDGSGQMALGSGAFEGEFSFRTRFEDADGTNPEELIGAALAGCFSMAFSNTLDEDGFTPDSVQTKARVNLTMGDDGPSIERIQLTCEASVPDIDVGSFQRLAQQAKENCPVSKALKGVDITLEASLTS